MEEKEKIMRNAMDEFHEELERNDGVVKGIRYKKDNEMEIQIRVDYLKDEFGETAAESELSKYRDSDGNWTSDICDETIWNSMLSNLSPKNI